VIVFNFSVLARPAENLSLRQPDSDGRALWGAMFDKYMARMIVVCDEVYDRTQFMDWLKREQFKASMIDFLDEVDPVLKAEKVHRIGSAAGKISWYVDNDARACSETIKLGIPTIVAVSPYIVRPEWDTGRKIKEWGSLVDEIDTQVLKAAERSWRDV
jgi:hypothetical protein